jgi:PII-like signaling protein
MSLEGPAQRLTIYVGSSDTLHGKNLALAIVELCRAEGLAGATVSRGIMGFGRHSRIHRAHFLGLSEDLPERIEIVDAPEQIGRILPLVQAMLDGGLILVQPVDVLAYSHHANRSGPTPELPQEERR